MSSPACIEHIPILSLFRHNCLGAYQRWRLAPTHSRREMRALTASTCGKVSPTLPCLLTRARCLVLSRLIGPPASFIHHLRPRNSPLLPCLASSSTARVDYRKILNARKISIDCHIRSYRWSVTRLSFPTSIMSARAAQMMGARLRSSTLTPHVGRAVQPLLPASRIGSEPRRLRRVRQSNQSQRNFATSRFEASNERPSGFQPRISHLFIGLAVLGLFVTTYGLLEWYFSFDQWPQEVRDDLRKAIKARNRGDVMRAEASFRE